MKSFVLVSLILSGAFLGRSTAAERPNLVFILADDLGYGDVQCLNPRGKIPTPNLDRLSKQGMAFTDAHASSSVCTPSRYSILTGRYNWRSRLQRGVLGGNAAPLIEKDRLTVPALLGRNGYATACIGKWHLGMTLPEKGDGTIPDGPVARGFDEFFGISASLDMPPYGFIHNDRFTAPLDTEKELFKGRRGPAQKDFEAVNVLPTLTEKAVAFIKEQVAKRQPFFLYLALTSPHTPLAPTKEWRGKSGLGDYGDFVMETDWAVGRVLAALDGAGIANDTLVIFTGDNGCAPYIDVAALEKKGHYPSAQFRGYKSDIWDGGHREPFLVRWPGRVKPGSKSGALVCLGDLMATCANILDVKLPADAGEDSVSLLPALQGGKAARENLVHHSIDGCFAIREGRWKLELCPGSGGWAAPRDAAAKKQGLPDVQLYDLSTDIGETKNVQAAHPDVVARLTKLLEQQIAAGRSTPGPKQANDVDVVVRKL